MDMIVEWTLEDKWGAGVEMRYTDSRKDERERELSLKSTPMSLILENSKMKSYLFNIMDTPGHPNFIDEVTAALRISDGAIVIIDVVEGVMLNTHQTLKLAVLANLPIILVLNKLDRLVIELRLPPNDAYHKIKHTLEEVNFILDSFPQYQSKVRISPLEGNVIFAASQFGACFTLQSFARIYSNMYEDKNKKLAPLSEEKTFPSDVLDKFFWGDVYYNKDRRKFQSKPPRSDSNRSFVQFILEPFYKIIAHAIGEDKKSLEPVLGSLGIYLKKNQFKMDTKPLLKIILQKIFGNLSCFVDSVIQHVPNAKVGNIKKVDL
jgi:116 kDa U5 small nuclear ribonucleoprotein component